MKNTFIDDMLGWGEYQGLGEETVLYRAGTPTAVRAKAGDVFLKVPFMPVRSNKQLPDDTSKLVKYYEIRIRAYSNHALRVSLAFEGETLPDSNPMMSISSGVRAVPLKVGTSDEVWKICAPDGSVRMRIDRSAAKIKPWQQTIKFGMPDSFRASVYPDGKTEIPFMSYDQFFPQHIESLPIGFISIGGKVAKLMYSLHALPNENFAGTGERFDRMNLAGKTMFLRNMDALGVNSRRAYKNVPFYVSSRPYGLFMHTSYPVKISFADISKRAVQALIDGTVLDLFFFGGGRLPKILDNYLEISGHPSEMPLWSYGTWMSRMTYFSADEVRDKAARLRSGSFPCDVLHIDTGWFAKDWVCEWEFSQERFPDPAAFMKEMKNLGFRISLWQTPNLGNGNKLLADAVKRRYVSVKKSTAEKSRSDFSEIQQSGHIDFTNPAAVKWYQGMLEKLLRAGVAAIKTDFGEEIDMTAEFMNMSTHELQNLYAVLYQRAAAEVTKKVTGSGIVWARAGWSGAQRYPLHWGGDAACSWDGLAGSLRGGLHLGLSGFAFWSHDVPGFHGIPDFMSSWPDDKLYVRWTQFGVFTSHLRYHGTTPREPYEYPRIAPVVRKWLKLRYALIPYLMREQKRSLALGLPILRALIIHHEDDPVCWNIDDQYYFGGDFLIAPIMNDEGVRDVYLPSGEWVDFWTGKVSKGGVWLRAVRCGIEKMPVYVRKNASVPFCVDDVQCTDEIDFSKLKTVKFDVRFKGIGTILKFIK